MGRLLREIDASAIREGPGFPHRIQVEEARRLYDTHPFVLARQLPSYRAVNRAEGAMTI